MAETYWVTKWPQGYFVTPRSIYEASLFSFHKTVRKDVSLKLTWGEILLSYVRDGMFEFVRRVIFQFSNGTFGCSWVH